MNSKSKVFMMGSLLIGMMETMSMPNGRREVKVNVGGSKHDKRRYSEILRDKGVKQYTIDGITVTAINEKSAIKKVNKIKAKL